MQDLQGLSINDFINKANVIVSKVEVDTDGLGDFKEIKTNNFSINSNINNIFQKSCSISFGFTFPNTQGKYSFYDEGAEYYNYVREGRKVKIHLGANLRPTTPKEEDDMIMYGTEDDETVYAIDADYTTAKEKTVGDGNLENGYELAVGQILDGIYIIQRSYLYFNVPAIPEGAVITKILLRMYITNSFILDDFDITIQNGMPDRPSIPNVLSDYNESHYSGNGGSTNTANVQGEGPYYYEVEFNETGRGWVIAGQMNKFTLRSSRDIAGIAPTGINYISLFSQNNPVPELRPTLYIEYEIPESKGDPADYLWTWIHGIIDKPKEDYSEKGESWKVNGSDYIAYLNKTAMKKLWWGDSKKYDVVKDQDSYEMESNCKGVYQAFLDRGNKDGTSFEEIYHNSEWTYDWDTNHFHFLYPSIPDFTETGCLWIYYFIEQSPEEVVADILVEAGLLKVSERPGWLTNTEHCIPTGVKISRLRFYSETKYLRALELISEVVLYRFYINGEGMPCFKPIPGLSEVIRRVDDNEYIVRSIEERIDELYNDITIIGEKREMKRKWLSVKAYTSVHDLTSNSGTLRGSITEDADNVVTKRGFKWNKIGEAENSWEESGSFSEGYFEHNITGLDADSEYRFCATAMDNLGKKKQSIWVYFKTEVI